jgi:mono/diheme cytochrome c family protein
VRIVKWALLVIVLLVLLAGGAAAGYFYVLHPKSRPPQDLKAPSSAEAIERGRYLATHVAGCIACHSKVDEEASGEPLIEGMAGSGREWPVDPEFPGRARAPNLTPDKASGIGGFTDGELVRAMREGVGRDGRPLFPMMPYPTYGKHLSDEDALAIVAYLRSLPPIANPVGKTEVGFPISMFVRTAPRPLETSPPPAPPPSDVEARGQWLLKMALCGDCHTPMDNGQPIAGKEYAGGNAFRNAKGVVYATNITSDPATGIGAYSDEDLLRVLNEGKNKAGQPLYIMPWQFYKGMTDEDKRALIGAVRKIPPVSNTVPAATIQR